MSTAAQITANRENAEKSTGPRTTEGKIISSRNAATHGLSGRLALLSDADQMLYTTRLERLVREMQPVSLIEEDLIKTIADSQWQIDRCRAYDQEIRANMLADSTSEAEAVRADFENAGVLDRVARYLARHTRAFHQALQEFDRQKKARLAAARAHAIETHERRTQTHFDPKRQKISVPNGFDLQKSAIYLDVLIARVDIARRQQEFSIAPDPETQPEAEPQVARQAA